MNSEVIKIKKTKYIIDFIMLCLIVSLMKLTITGMLWHEILGIAVFIVFIIHKILNWNWIKAITKNLFTNKLNTKTKVTFFIDVLLLISTVLTAISGIGISKNILTNLAFADIELWTIIHYISAYSLFALISIHLAMHLKNIISSIKKSFNIQNKNSESNIGRYVAVFLSIIGLIAYMSDKKLVEIYNFFTNSNDGVTTESNTFTSTNIDEISFTTNDTKYKLVAIGTASSTDATLQKKLSSTICTGCHRRCPLSAPQCSIGERQADQLIATYNSSNSSSSSSSNDSSSSSNSTSSSNNSSSTTTDNEVSENITNSENDINMDSNSNNTNTEETDNSYNVDDLVPAEEYNTKSTTTNSTAGDVTRILLEMGFWIGGTYYILETIDKKKDK